MCIVGLASFDVTLCFVQCIQRGYDLAPVIKIVDPAIAVRTSLGFCDACRIRETFFGPLSRCHRFFNLSTRMSSAFSRRILLTSLHSSKCVAGRPSLRSNTSAIVGLRLSATGPISYSCVRSRTTFWLGASVAALVSSVLSAGSGARGPRWRRVFVAASRPSPITKDACLVEIRPDRLAACGQFNLVNLLGCAIDQERVRASASSGGIGFAQHLHDHRIGQFH